ncbi:4'-phosphopantetheinyl transferase superfamily protein [Bosea sp. BK604]|uniref:4'-phosphopantetheinyl transferase family protein n=1 Tax=Bosea sp. BK604 TaxID=2512180 RepID=UPI00104AE15F|nr:4'-phosphopantetheinyl transferase superfamily protein [Bosea sp. BK604]TCR61162.1 4'-phosphopantetheinyl transferase superfamily protein [Bosea sp. BK604]
MIWLTSPDATASTLPAGWLIDSGEHPHGLTERSALRRETARRLIARQFNLEHGEVEIEHDERGKPILRHPAGTGLHLSLATRAGLVAVALAHDPVGIDVERIDPDIELPLTSLHPQESEALLSLPVPARPLAFAQLWSAKEAYVKALGLGFARAPESFAVTLLSTEQFEVSDPNRPGVIAGTGRTIENGGQGTLAAAIVVLA